MQVSQYLYNNAQSIWGDCISHPFVQGIGHGTLERDKFRFESKIPLTNLLTTNFYTMLRAFVLECVLNWF